MNKAIRNMLSYLEQEEIALSTGYFGSLCFPHMYRVNSQSKLIIGKQKCYVKFKPLHCDVIQEERREVFPNQRDLVEIEKQIGQLVKEKLMDNKLRKIKEGKQ